MELWNKEADYIVRSKNEEYNVHVFFWLKEDNEKGVDIEIRRGSHCVHMFSLSLEKGHHVNVA
jgi:hypothetical protein